MSFRWKIAQTAELKWWQNYLSHKSTDSYKEWKERYWNDFLKELPFLINPNSSILDAGCGPAGIFTILDDHQVTACDPLLNAYEQKLDHFDPENFPWTNFVSKSLEDFTQVAQFDYVFCLNAINHVDDLAKSLDNLIQSLKPGGILVISIDAHNYSGLKKIFQLIPGDILHPHQYDRKDYRKMIEDRAIVLENGKCLKKEFIFNYWLEWGIKKS